MQYLGVQGRAKGRRYLSVTDVSEGVLFSCFSIPGNGEQGTGGSSDSHFLPCTASLDRRFLSFEGKHFKKRLTCCSRVSRTDIMASERERLVATAVFLASLITQSEFLIFHLTFEVIHFLLYHQCNVLQKCGLVQL